LPDSGAGAGTVPPPLEPPERRGAVAGGHRRGQVLAALQVAGHGVAVDQHAAAVAHGLQAAAEPVAQRFDGAPLGVDLQVAGDAGAFDAHAVAAHHLDRAAHAGRTGQHHVRGALGLQVAVGGDAYRVERGPGADGHAADQARAFQPAGGVGRHEHRVERDGAEGLVDAGDIARQAGRRRRQRRQRGQRAQALVDGGGRVGAGSGVGVATAPAAGGQGQAQRRGEGAQGKRRDRGIADRKRHDGLRGSMPLARRDSLPPATGVGRRCGPQSGEAPRKYIARPAGSVRRC
jgi:hypothetical protein